MIGDTPIPSLSSSSLLPPPCNCIYKVGTIQPPTHNPSINPGKI